MNYPKVSIITINFNDSKGLEKTILSVRSQLFRNYEHIIIDGGSKDDSKFIIEKYKDGFSKWVSESDKGIYDAQNKGIKFAKGEYCLFLNSGDYLAEENVLDKIWIGSSYSHDILYGDMFVPTKNGKLRRLYQAKNMNLYHLFKDTIWHPSSFIRRELFQKIGLYSLNYKICSDYEFWMKAFKLKYKFKYIHIPISVFNEDGLSSKTENQRFVQEERKKIQKEFSPISLYYLYSIILMINNSYLKLLSNMKSIIKKFLLNG